MKLFDYCLNRRAIREEMRVEAVGMDSIRRLYPSRARMIRHAHEQAVSYLSDTMRNLDRLFFDGRLDQRRRLFVEKFFDTSQVSEYTIRKIKLRAHIMLGELLKPSLNPETSSRYIVGSAVHPEHSIQAFTLPREATRRIYFTERFFDPGFQVYLPMRPRTFDMLGHNMGTVLLHEVSHLVLDTVDLAYLDSSRPFLDLLDTSTLTGRIRHDALERIQKHGFSSSTPANELFKELDDYDLHWYDLVGKSCQRVLRLTGTQDLDEARRVFLSDENKRIDVILNNADSLALLLAHLGRPPEYHPAN
ncbi:hypothetical protein [Pseudomonas gingeri]|uniref:Uncharacterized protein n=1 Tax=Pseudomonas gingeri TaxID=117681 RepID=A0A7Y7Y8L0_9PSED|nr:hypothetical protein [Pseudomonas gingeri]NWB27255.1 hypothetical protein [Pseudomonas gingeri]NWC31748.1 hypothetical protein [Pseudomonas gingeri]NWD09706.1 hypothetical protein [Pseudomonas gingeri]NWD46885.1 hypothetical protein [Pseudomonas gingeri]NWE36832.1 hypothetical protein [Pseudomonas gingeri]